MRRRTLLVSGALASLASVILRGVGFGRESAPRTGPRAGYFPNAILRTHENKPVRFYDDLIKGKVVLINFMYTNGDGLCPRQTANLAAVQRALGDRVGRDIFMYSITLKPEEDTPKVLQQYAKSNGVKPGWLFLTGKPEDVENLRRKLGFVDPDPIVDRDKSQHIGVVRVGNDAIGSWTACPALSAPTQIARVIGWMDVPKTRGT